MIYFLGGKFFDAWGKTVSYGIKNILFLRIKLFIS